MLLALAEALRPATSGAAHSGAGRGSSDFLLLPVLLDRLSEFLDSTQIN